MNELNKVREHLEFMIRLETDTMAHFDVEENEHMRRHCVITRNTYQEVLDYIVKLQKKLEKEVK